MPAFLFEALNGAGKPEKGRLEAESVEAAEDILVSRGYIPTKVTAALDSDNRDFPSRGGGIVARLKALTGGVKSGDLIIFTKQIRSMMHAGVPIVRLLQVLENQTQNSALRWAVNRMAADIREGSSLYEAISKHPRIFPPLYRSMIRAGETSGSVPEVLQRLIYIIEHEAKVKADVKAAMQYPLIVLIALAIAFVVLLMFVVPTFARIFAGAGMELPLPTRVAIGLYDFLSAYWLLILAVIIVCLLGLRAYFRTASGGLALDRALLRLPLAGPLFQKAALSRFASILAILYASGVHVMTAMEIVGDTIGNRAIAQQLTQARERIREGQGLAQPLRSARYFSPMVIDMIAIGEESGNIEEMMREVAVHYDDEVAYSVKALSDAIGPILIVGLAGVVGFFALAIFLPMWDMVQLVR